MSKQCGVYEVVTHCFLIFLTRVRSAESLRTQASSILPNRTRGHRARWYPGVGCLGMPEEGRPRLSAPHPIPAKVRRGREVGEATREWGRPVPLCEALCIKTDLPGWEVGWEVVTFPPGSVCHTADLGLDMGVPTLWGCLQETPRIPHSMRADLSRSPSAHDPVGWHLRSKNQGSLEGEAER